MASRLDTRVLLVLVTALTTLAAERNPVKGAYVSVFGTGAASDDSGTATTDERGLARLAGLHGGDYMINVEQSGFQRTQQVPVKVRVSVQSKFYEADGGNAYNVIAELPGTDPALRDEVVMFGAHLAQARSRRFQ